jgi:hypothetical protein
MTSIRPAGPPAPCRHQRACGLQLEPCSSEHPHWHGGMCPPLRKILHCRQSMTEPRTSRQLKPNMAQVQSLIQILTLNSRKALGVLLPSYYERRRIGCPSVAKHGDVHQQTAQPPSWSKRMRILQPVPGHVRSGPGRRAPLQKPSASKTHGLRTARRCRRFQPLLRRRRASGSKRHRRLHSRQALERQRTVRITTTCSGGGASGSSFF